MNSKTYIMKRLSKALLFILLLATAAACEDSRCIQGDGYVVTKDRYIGSFNAVRTEGSWQVEIIKSPYSYVSVVGESNILPYVSTEIENNELVIRPFRNTCWDETYPLRIYVYTPVLSSLITEGSGDVFIDTASAYQMYLAIEGSGNVFGFIDANSVDVRINGSGNFSLSGDANSATMEINGSGNINAFNLFLYDNTITIDGSGDVKTFVSSLLDGTINGSGNIYFKGYPQIYSDINGSGRLINAN